MLYKSLCEKIRELGYTRDSEIRMDLEKEIREIKLPPNSVYTDNKNNLVYSSKSQFNIYIFDSFYLAQFQNHIFVFSNQSPDHIRPPNIASQMQTSA